MIGRPKPDLSLFLPFSLWALTESSLDWGRKEDLYLAGCNCILFLFWWWLCIWRMVSGHRSNRYSVASSLEAGSVYSYLRDCTIWLTWSLSPVLVTAMLGHCPACCGWGFLAQQAALKWCVEVSWHKAVTVPHGHSSYRNPEIWSHHAKSWAAAAPRPCLLSHHHSVLHLLPKLTVKEIKFPVWAVVQFGNQESTHVSLQAMAILMSHLNWDEEWEIFPYSLGWLYSSQHKYCIPHKENLKVLFLPLHLVESRVGLRGGVVSTVVQWFHGKEDLRVGAKPQEAHDTPLWGLLN